MNYSIAIPSHRRPDTIKANVLKLIEESDMKPQSIDIFVSDEKDAQEYQTGHNIIVTNAKNLSDKHNAIHNHYPAGTNVLVLEDDVVQITIKKGNKTVETKEVEKWVQMGFKTATESGADIFGISPTNNGFYMDNSVTVNFKFIVGYMFGFVSRQNDCLHTTTSIKHDYERTVKYFIENGRTPRLNHISCKTNSFKNTGGLQHEYDKDTRAEAEEAAVVMLTQKYPHLLARQKRENKVLGTQTELRLKKPPKGVDLKQYQKHLES